MFDDFVALEDLRLVDEAQGEAVAHVRIGRTIVAARVVGVERSVAAVKGSVGPANLTGVGGASPSVIGKNLETIAEGTADSHGERVVPGVGYAETGVDRGDGRVAAVRLQVDRDGELAGDVVVCVLNVVGGYTVRSLADEVGIEKDGQAQSAGAYVSNGEGHLAGERLLDAELGFVGQRRNEVGIETVEALRP